MSAVRKKKKPYKKPKAEKSIAFEGITIERPRYRGPGAPLGKPLKSELKRLKKEKMANWPPSRGPLPKHLDFSQQTFVFPAVHVSGPYAHDRDSPEQDFNPPKRRKKKLPRSWEDDRKYLSISVWQQVTDLLQVDALTASTLVNGQAEGESFLIGGLPANRTYHADLDYPFRGTARVTIKPFVRKGRGKEMTIGWLLFALAQAYEAVYENHERYGIWGHHIGDLGFEQIIIKGDQVWVGVGS